MLTNKDYCDFDTCVALWNMGLIPHPYDNTDTDKVMAIITLYEAQKWLREEKGFNVLVDHIMTEDGDWCYNITHLGRSAKVFKSYEEALSEGIKEAVKLLKEK